MGDCIKMQIWDHQGRDRAWDSSILTNSKWGYCSEGPVQWSVNALWRFCPCSHFLLQSNFLLLYDVLVVVMHSCKSLQSHEADFMSWKCQLKGFLSISSPFLPSYSRNNCPCAPWNIQRRQQNRTKAGDFVQWSVFPYCLKSQDAARKSHVHLLSIAP